MRRWYNNDYHIHEIQRALCTAEARYLLSSLPTSIRHKFVWCYFSNDSQALSDVLAYFVQNSEIGRLANRNPGLAGIFEYLYHKRHVYKPIDRYFIKSNVGRSMHKRLVALRKNLPRLISQELRRRNGNTLVIDNIGSGPGHDMIDVLVEHPELAPKVHVRNIEPDSNALEIGMRRVESLGLSESFSFLNMKFEEVADFHAHMILLIGIFCPMKRRICEFMLKKLRTLYEPETLVVYSTVQQRMAGGDLLMRFIMEFMGWPMDYKTDEETEAIARASGWQPLEQFFDEPLRYNCIQVARNSAQ